MKYHNTKLGRAYNEDCFEVMKTIPDGCVDMILADLPYGTTACKWDNVIPFEPMWKEFHRIAKPNAAIVLTASQPFTSALVMSNVKSFKYEVIWEKEKPSDFATSKFRTMKYHESILIFSLGRETYNPQMTQGKPNHCVGKGIRKKANESGANTKFVSNKLDGLKHPKSVIKINRNSKNFHPTQKPVALFEYIIKTYTNEKALVFDPTAGSLTTGVAAENLNRRWVCCEKETEYFEKGVARFEA